MNEAHSIRICLSTVPTAQFAKQLAATLVEERLAACVQILPAINSIYHWQGKLCDETESMLFIKTSFDKIVELEKRITELHPYDTPEILVIAPQSSNSKYADWLNEYLA